jgi:hypothetical protein
MEGKELWLKEDFDPDMARNFKVRTLVLIKRQSIF